MRTNRFIWQVLKERPQSSGGKRGRSGHGEEHVDALLEDREREITKQEESNAPVEH